jgi:hypothetical protein
VREKEERPVVLTTFAIVTDGLVYAAYLFLVAAGLTLIFGVMKILNVAHGSFYAFGAYGAATAVGIYFGRGWPEAGGFLLMIVLAMAIGMVVGLVLERGILRLVYGRDEIVIVLVTYACFLILEDTITLIWGAQSYAAYQPMVAAGDIEIGDLIVELRHRPRRHRERGRARRLLGAQLRGGAGCSRWSSSTARRRRCSASMSAGLHRDLRHRRRARRARRRHDGPEDLGDARHRRRGHRARLRRRRHRRDGLDRGRGARCGNRRPVPGRRGPSRSQLELFVIYAVMALVLIFRPYGLFSQAAPRKI